LGGTEKTSIRMPNNKSGKASRKLVGQFFCGGGGGRKGKEDKEPGTTGNNLHSKKNKRGKDGKK